MVLRKSSLIVLVSLLVVSTLLAACGPTPEVQTVRETVIVEGTPRVVEKEVTKVVQETVQVPVEVTAPPPPKGGKLVFTGNKYPSGLDPHVNAGYDVLWSLAAIYDTLVYQDQDGSFVPGLATSWEVSDDGKTYTLHLREDVKFHDGTPFDGAAVKYNFDRIVAPETKSQMAAGLLGPYESTEVVDDHTVKVHLKDADAFFLQALSLTYVAMCSPTAVEKWGTDYQLHQVGTGPFIFQEYVPQDHITLVPNPDYNWAPAIFEHQGPPYLEEITWHFLPDPATRLPALQAGDADVVMDLPPYDGNKVMNDSGLVFVVNLQTGQPLYWEMNTEKEPTDDLAVRQAILYGTDRQAIVNAVLKGHYPLAYGPLTAVTPEYSPEVEKMYAYDLDKAKSLLEQAGWVDSNNDGIREKDGKPLALSMALQGWGFTQPLGEMLQGQLRQLGIDATTEMLTWPAQMEVGAKGLKNLTVMGGNALLASDAMSKVFASQAAEGGMNWSKIRDPELDALLQEGVRTLDLDQRKAVYAKAQADIMDKALIIPIYDYALLVAYDKKVKGLTFSRIGLTPYVYEAYVGQ